MELWTMSLIVFYMAYQHDIQEVGIRVLKRQPAVMKNVRAYRCCGKLNSMMVNWVMLTGADVEVKNVTYVRPNAKDDVEF